MSAWKALTLAAVTSVAIGLIWFIAAAYLEFSGAVWWWGAPIAVGTAVAICVRSPRINAWALLFLPLVPALFVLGFIFLGLPACILLGLTNCK